MLCNYVAEWLSILGRVDFLINSENDPALANRDHKEIDTIKAVADSIKPRCEALGLEHSLTRLRGLSSLQWVTCGELAIEYRLLKEIIEDELRSRNFFFVPLDREKYYNQHAPFGWEVQGKFSSASFHIQEGGNCIALARWTAAVFHLMCVLEVGLDSLRDALNLKESLNSWQISINEIEAAIRGVRPGTSPTWKEDQEFYRKAATEFGYFQVAWRNHACHGRAKYTEEEARKVYEHVRDFMMHIATRLQQRA